MTATEISFPAPNNMDVPKLAVKALRREFLKIKIAIWEAGEESSRKVKPKV